MTPSDNFYTDARAPFNAASYSTFLRPENAAEIYIHGYYYDGLTAQLPCTQDQTLTRATQQFSSQEDSTKSSCFCKSIPRFDLF